MRFVGSEMCIAAHDGPIGSLDIAKEKPLFFGTCPVLGSVFGVAGDEGIGTGGDGEGEAGHGSGLAGFV
ncbi:MAG: hypothetical protein GKR98_03185 [Boseongicola sp.]|nr:MAG: hypothetical protein GKR98_03185 [Boseongicola sp.]